MSLSSTHNSSSTTSNVHLRIINVTNGQIKVELCLPINLVGIAQRSGAQVLPPNTSLEAIVAQASQTGAVHFSWEDAAHEERLELTLE